MTKTKIQMLRLIHQNLNLKENQISDHEDEILDLVKRSNFAPPPTDEFASIKYSSRLDRLTHLFIEMLNEM